MNLNVNLFWNIATKQLPILHPIAIFRDVMQNEVLSVTPANSSHIQQYRHSLASGPSLVSVGNGERKSRRYRCKNDVSVYSGRQRVDGRSRGPTQSRVLCINEQYKDLKA